MRDWKDLLQRTSARLLDVADAIDLEHVEPKQAKARWLGAAPASEARIAAKEEALGVTLPVDYRGFLLASNGFMGLAQFPYGLCDLDPVERIDTFGNRDESTGRLDSFIRDGLVDLMEGASVPPEHQPLQANEVHQWIMIGDSDGNECILLRPVSQGPWQLWIFDEEQGLDWAGTFGDFMQAGPSWTPA